MLIGQAGNIGEKMRQEVKVEQRVQEYSGKEEAPSISPAQTTEKQDEKSTFLFLAEKSTESCG